jgi:hypothetical protein
MSNRTAQEDYEHACWIAHLDDLLEQMSASRNVCEYDQGCIAHAALMDFSLEYLSSGGASCLR